MNKLAKVIGGKAVGKILKPIAKFGAEHSTEILTGVAIGASIGDTVVLYRNAPEIRDIIAGAQMDIAMVADDDDLTPAEIREQKKEIYISTLKELTPLVAPILAFKVLTIGCTIGLARKTKKQQAKIASLTAGLAVTNAALEEYQIFKEEVSKVVGEEKVKEVEKEVEKKTAETVVKRSEIYEDPSIEDGDEIFIDKWSGRKYGSNDKKLEMAVQILENKYKDLGDDDPLTLNDWYDIIGLEPTDAGEVIGWVKDDEREHISFSKHIWCESKNDGKRTKAYLIASIYPAPTALPDE